MIKTYQGGTIRVMQTINPFVGVRFTEAETRGVVRMANSMDPQSLRVYRSPRGGCSPIPSIEIAKTAIRSANLITFPHTRDKVSIRRISHSFDLTSLEILIREIAKLREQIFTTLSKGVQYLVCRPIGYSDHHKVMPSRGIATATNTAAAGAAPADTYAFMPPGVPSAEWLNLFDGSTIGMSSRPTGARWHVVLGAGDARVYVIDKNQK